MLTQIIFFLSLGAFIVLLLRRYNSDAVRVSGLGSWFNKFVKAIISNLPTSLPSKNGRKISLPKLNLNLPRKAGGTQAVADSEHTFWQEEGHGNREISSHFEEGEDLLNQGKSKEAEQLFLKAAANNPGDAKVYAKLGLLYLSQKNYSDAIESLKMAVKLEKYNPSRHYNLALAYWGNKDTRRAIASVREAISLDPVTPKYRKLLEELLNG